MTRKQLPKAIKPTDADLRLIDVKAEAQSSLHGGGSPRPAEPQSEVWRLSPPPANDPLPVATCLSQPQAEIRLREAFKIIERHKLYAGLGGLVPMPAVNVVSVTAVILRMVKLLSDLYGVPFEREKTRSIVIGLMGGATPSTVAAASLTRRIGISFLERFERDAVG